MTNFQATRGLSPLQWEHPAEQHFKTLNIFTFIFCGSLCLPGFGSRDPIESGSNPYPDSHPVQVQKCACLLPQLSGFESRHLSKILNVRHKHSSGQHTVALQKMFKKGRITRNKNWTYQRDAGVSGVPSRGKTGRVRLNSDKIIGILLYISVSWIRIRRIRKYVASWIRISTI